MTSALRSRGMAIATVTYTAIVYATLPVAPVVWYHLLPLLRPHVTLWIAGAGAAVLTGLAWLAWRRHGWPGLVMVLGVGVAYLALLVSFYTGPAPAKKVHLLEYAVLTFGAFEAVRADLRRGVFLAVGYALAAGVLDECIQGLLPTRTFGVKDIVGNWLGTALGLLSWLAVSRHSRWPKEMTAP